MKAYSSSCKAIRKRNRKSYLNLLLINTTLTLQREQCQSEDSKGVVCAGEAQIVQSRKKDIRYLLPSRGLAETMASAHAASFQSLTLCGSVHTVWSTAWWVLPWLKQCMHVACDAHPVQAPGEPSEQKIGSPQHRLCAPWQLQSQGGSRLCCSGPWGKWCALSRSATAHPA